MCRRVSSACGVRRMTRARLNARATGQSAVTRSHVAWMMWMMHLRTFSCCGKYRRPAIFSYLRVMNFHQQAYLVTYRPLSNEVSRKLSEYYYTYVTENTVNTRFGKDQPPKNCERLQSVARACARSLFRRHRADTLCRLRRTKRKLRTPWCVTRASYHAPSADHAAITAVRADRSPEMHLAPKL